MNPITAIIVDDELAAREVLKSLLSFHSESITVLAECCDLPEAVEKIKELQPDVVFLDIQMPNYAGYEITRFFNEIDFEIIFITAYDEYAIKAFELNAIDYLVKPIERKRLQQTIERLQNRFKQEVQIQDYKRLLDTIKNNDIEKIVVSESGKRHSFKLDDIIAFKASGSYCKILLTNSSEVMISKNLKYFETLLKDSTTFFRVHRAWLINTSHFRYLHKTTLEAVLTNEIKAKISRYKLDDFETII